jgi:hypothetical protein
LITSLFFDLIISAVKNACLDYFGHGMNMIFLRAVMCYTLIRANNTKEGACLNADISKHTKDLIQKHTAALLREIMPDFYGIKIGRVKELINPELPDVMVAGGGTDMVFLTDDDKYLHLGFESGKEKSDILKHLSYDARLTARDGREVVTVIVYTSDVTTAPTGIKGETLVYTPHIILMADYDGDTVYAELNAKITAGLLLKDKDILNLLFLPLMRNTIPKNELVLRSVEMAKTIGNYAKREASMAAALALSYKHLNKSELEKVKEAMEMQEGIDWLAGIIEERIKERTGESVKKAEESVKKDLARNMLQAGETVIRIAQYTKLDKEIILGLQAELELIPA